MERDDFGKLVTIEGANEVGKSTLAKGLTAQLEERGVPCTRISFPGKKDGTLGKMVYDLHHDPLDFGVRHLEPAALQMMHIAAHADAISNRIRPLLDEGITVILDRFWWSTWIYGRASGVSETVLRRMIDVEESFWNGRMPDMAFLVDRKTPLGSKLDFGIWERLRDDYRILADAQRDDHPVTVIENDSSPHDAVGEMMDALTPML